MIAGVDVFRINFSHGEHSRHAETIANIRKVEKKLDRAVAILADLQGPRIRLGKLPEAGVALRRGEIVQFSYQPGFNDRITIPVSHARFAKDVRPGARILIADGEIELKVKSIDGDRVAASVVYGGLLKSSKGINLPDCNVSIATLTKKDRADLAFAARHGVDAIAVSFVGDAADVKLAKKLLAKEKSAALVVAKIERTHAIANLTKIIEASDAVMVARGDLAVEVGYENVPVLQKEIIQKSIALARPVIVATQMLDSMIEHPRPTRAEASDVANAIFERADAVMLSGETAVGAFPVETVRTMSKIIQRIERYISQRDAVATNVDDTIRHECAIASAAVNAAARLKAKCIVPFTTSGRSARLVSRERPDVSIISFAESKEAMRRLCFYWGVEPRCLQNAKSMAEHFAHGERQLLKNGDVARGDFIIFLAGFVKVPGATNTLRVHRAGDPIE